MVIYYRFNVRPIRAGTGDWIFACTEDFDKRPYPLSLSRVNISNVGINSK